MVADDLNAALIAFCKATDQLQEAIQDLEKSRTAVRAYRLLIEELLAQGYLQFVKIYPYTDAQAAFVKGSTLFGSSVEEAVLSMLDSNSRKAAAESVLAVVSSAKKPQ